MTTEAQNKDTTGTQESTSTTPAGGAPAAQQTTTKNDKQQQTAPTTTAAPSGGGTSEKKPKVISGDDDEIPEGEDLLQMSPRALNARIARASRKALKDAFGTDDVDSIKKMIDKAQKAAAKEEEERKKSLTEAERLKEERDAAIRERDEARTQLTAAERGRIVERQDSRITRIAEKYLDPDYIESEMPRLAADLRKAFKEKDPKLLKDEGAWLEKWFEKRVAAKPKLGKDYDSKREETTQPDPKKVALNNGARTDDRHTADKSVSGAQKTAAPGKPNSMSYKEINQSGYAWK